MEPEIKLYNHRIVMQDENIDCQIIADDVDDMEPYVRKLFEWASTAWDYQAVEDWNTEEYSLLHAQEGFFKVHKLGRDDKKGLFLGAYVDSPAPLEDYEDREIHAYVYLKITKEEYEKLYKNKNGDE